MERQVMNAKEVAQACGVSETSAYKIIKELNSELSSKGYITIRGKVSKVFFCEKMYGAKECI